MDGRFINAGRKEIVGREPPVVSNWFKTDSTAVSANSNFEEQPPTMLAEQVDARTLGHLAIRVAELPEDGLLVALGDHENPPVGHELDIEDIDPEIERGEAVRFKWVLLTIDDALDLLDVIVELPSE